MGQFRPAVQDSHAALLREHDTRSRLLLVSCGHVCHGGRMSAYNLLASWSAVQLHHGN